MKWVLNKENDECKVLIKDSNGDRLEFSYIKMIGILYEEKKMDSPEFGEGFSDEEKESISKLVNAINECISM